MHCRRWLLGLRQALAHWLLVGGFLGTLPPAVPAATSVPAAPGGTGAQWIWRAADGPKNTWMCLRHEVDLPIAPSAAPATIAVDSKYWLWINGELAVFEGGLKRGPTPTDTWYDEVDLAPWLTAGTNTIAVLVWYFGDNGFSHRDSGRGGLLFSMDADGVAVTSDSTWRCVVHPAFGVTAAPWPNYTLSEQNIRFDATADSVAGWTLPGFDDSAWPFATEKGPAGSSPWNALVRRPIPQWRNSGFREYENAGSFPAVGDGGEIVARLPYNAQVTPYLEVSASAGAVIDIRTDHYLGGGPENVRAEYVTKDGWQAFESPAWFNGHEVHYTIPAGVQILTLRYRETGYDTDLSGSFTCSDPFFDQLWAKARRTLYVCMRDNFMDCPDRERAQYWGDVVNELGECFYALDPASHALIAKGIRDLVNWQRPDSTLYAPVPSGNWGSELPIQILASVGTFGFWTYYLHTGDASVIQDAYPHVRDYLAIWVLGGDGLVAHRAGDWDWYDWGGPGAPDGKVLDNAWYALALQAARKMALLTGNAADVPGYEARLDSLQASFDAVLWDGTAYRSPGYAGVPDDRANAMALLSGLAGETRWPAIRTVLLQQHFASPWMERFALEALYRMNCENDALDRMKSRYAQMVSAPPTTLWEKWAAGAWTSENHAWAGGPLILLSQYAAGLAAQSPGWSTFAVRPQEGALTQVHAVVPSASGDIAVDLERSGGTYTLHLDSPPATVATVGIRKDVFDGIGSLVDRIAANGTVIWSNGSFVGGVGGLSDAGEDDRYLLFDVQPGAWNLEATAAAVSAPVGFAAIGPALEPPAPNPFRRDCRLRFALPAEASVDLVVYDPAGRRVRRLVHRVLPAGPHDTSWEAVDSDGRPVASGVYYVILRTPGHREARPVTVLR